MAFDEAAVRAAVAHFAAVRGLTVDTLTVILRLDRALGIAVYRGTDATWRTARFWSADDDPGDTLFGDAADITGGSTPSITVGPGARAETRTVFDRVLDAELRRRRPGRRWLDTEAVVVASRWARFSRSLTDAHAAGLGWLVPARGELLAVPLPTVRTAEGRPDLLHDDTGRPAVEWRDGIGDYYLRGAEFEPALYRKVLGSELLIQQIAQLENADQRSVALTFLSFEKLVVDSDAELVDVGVRGTRLYRLPLPWRIRRDRVPGYGAFDYFIHMRDASHPEREFVEWVDPAIGRHHDAELCQAHAFGITLEQWLSVEVEG